jgi:hypothetical protein
MALGCYACRVWYGMVWYMSRSARTTSPSYPCSINSALIALAVACLQAMGGRVPILSLFLSKFSDTFYKSMHTLMLHIYSNRLQINNKRFRMMYVTNVCKNVNISTPRVYEILSSWPKPKGDWNGPISVQHFAVTGYINGVCIYSLQFRISTDI